MLSGNIGSYATAQAPNSYYADNLLEQKDPKAIGAQFEAMLFRIILKQMREGEIESPLFDGPGMEIVSEMRDDELAQHLGALGQLGISGLIEAELKESQSLGLLKNP